ncbi:MAG: hypothetical protein U0527_06795 [Candidatus Eisenbacteria bacterium]
METERPPSAALREAEAAAAEDQTDPALTQTLAELRARIVTSRE